MDIITKGRLIYENIKPFLGTYWQYVTLCCQFLYKRKANPSFLSIWFHFSKILYLNVLSLSSSWVSRSSKDINLLLRYFWRYYPFKRKISLKTKFFPIKTRNFSKIYHVGRTRNVSNRRIGWWFYYKCKRKYLNFMSVDTHWYDND